MQPVVIAWTLLFVVAFAVVYRFFVWIARRRPRAPSAPAQRDDIGRPVEVAKAEALAIPSDASPAAPIKAVEAAPVEPPPPSPLPLAAAPEIVALPPMPMPSSAVMSARIAAEAVRTALPPSVAATLPPRPKPSVAATLPPKPSEPLREESEHITTAPTVDSAAMPAASTPPISTQEDVSIAEPGDPLSPQSFQGVVEASKFSRLRARRMGFEAPSLDIRLRDSRERRSSPAPKVLRGSTGAASEKSLRVLIVRASQEKAPARRIGRKPDGISTIASTRTRTKIIGSPPRSSRILTATAP